MNNPLQEHLDAVVNPTWNFAGKLERPQDHFLNAVVGISSEAGELLDIHKKVWFHTKPIHGEQQHIKSELGDIIYYWLKAVDLHGFTVEEVLAYNKEKLESRHPELGKVAERFGAGAING